MRFAVLFVSLSLLFSHCLAQKVALVLGGGGARGAFHVGVIKNLCGSPKHRNSWDMIVSSSIGAINGAILAQFNKNEQCEKGLPALTSFWESIDDQDDIFESYSWVSLGKCLNTVNLYSLGKGFYRTGGMCSYAPGERKFQQAVNFNAIKKSNMEYHFASTGLHDTEHPVWFEKGTNNLFEHIMASASLVLLFPPKEIQGKLYMDGSCFTDIPVTRALELGATEIKSILLFNMDGHYEGDIFEAEREEKMGPTTLEYIYNVVHRNAFLISDLRFACHQYPGTPIYGIVPEDYLGHITDFTRAHIKNTIQQGFNQVKKSGFIDLCLAGSLLPGQVGKSFIPLSEYSAKVDASSANQSVFISVGIAVAGALIGGFVVFAVFARKAQKYTFIPVEKQ